MKNYYFNLLRIRNSLKDDQPIINGMDNTLVHRILNIGLAMIWMINGLICKILNLVPRHELIVSKILGSENARLLTVLIGISEVIMAMWILSRFKTRLNTVVQIMVIATMNVIEFILVPDLLLWGKFNSIFAGILILIIYINEFVLKRKPNAIIPKKSPFRSRGFF